MDTQELLLNTLIDKVTSYEKELHKIQEQIEKQPHYDEDLNRICEQVEALKMDVQQTPDKISIPVGLIADLRRELAEHRIQLQKPLQKEVRHHHRMHWSILLSLVLVVLMAGLVVLLVQARQEVRQHLDADLKYRSLLLSKDQNLLEILHTTDTIYRNDPDRFGRWVIHGEREREERLENLLRLEEAKEQQRQLEEKLKPAAGQQK